MKYGLSDVFDLQMGKRQIDETTVKGFNSNQLKVIGVCLLTFCSDWSCIAVMAIVSIGSNRGNFKKQMLGMMFYGNAGVMIGS